MVSCWKEEGICRRINFIQGIWGVKCHYEKVIVQRQGTHVYVFSDRSILLFSFFIAEFLICMYLLHLGNRKDGISELIVLILFFHSRK